MTYTILQQSGPFMTTSHNDIFALIKIKTKADNFNKFTLGQNIVFIWDRRGIQKNEVLPAVTETKIQDSGVFGGTL